MSHLSNLQTRIVTALVLAVLLIGTLLMQSTALWAAVVALFCVGAIWEGCRLYGRASGAAHVRAWLLALLVLVGLAAAVFVWRAAAHGLVTGYLAAITLFWLLAVPRQLQHRRIATQSLASWVVFSMLVGGAWLAAVLLQQLGAAWLIAVVVTTVLADVAAYFVGRAFGRHKLAPAISPGKTREGAAGGIIAAALWVAAAACGLGVATTALQIAVAAVAGAGLGACAVMGDLWESLLKRQAGVKDSSQLLPGHGGVLDRIDAQLAVLPIATLLISLVKPLW